MFNENDVRQLEQLITQDEARIRARTAAAPPPPMAGNSSLVQGVDDAGRLFADGASFGYADKLAARGDAIINSGLQFVGMGDPGRAATGAAC